MNGLLNGIRLTLLAGVMALAGCATQPLSYTIMTHDRTAAVFGGIKLYGTDNVPFEYEEIGVHSLIVKMTDQQAAQRAFAEQVKELGADAVLNFEMKPLPYEWVVFGFDAYWDLSQYQMSGVAVKIKRP